MFSRFLRSLASRSLTRACFVTALGVSVAAAGAAGCSKPPPPTTAQVKPGDMPAGGDWTGVFYSPLYGHLHLVQQGTSVSGRWRTAGGDKWGELHGEATGDVLRYEWVEYKIGMVGPGASTRGHGYFKYYVPADENANHEIKGEWGLERSEVGNSWEAIRQRNMLPDLAAVKPDETERVNMPDAWDDASGSGGKAPSSGDSEAGESPDTQSDEDM